MTGSVQFKGKDSVVNAFSNMDIECFAIWQQKQFMFRGKGSADLETILQMMSEGMTNAIYTLCVYDGIDDPKKIKSNTANDGSFNFRLNSDNMEITNGQYMAQNNTHSRLTALEENNARILALLENEEPEEPKLGMIGAILEHPTLAPVIQKMLLTMIDPNGPAPAQLPVRFQNLQPVQMAAVGNITTDAILLKALETLKKHDPKLTEHLHKLAFIAEKDPVSFEIIISTLEKF